MALRRAFLRRLAASTAGLTPAIVLSPAEDAAIGAEIDHLFRQVWTHYQRLYDWR